jgi:hypothetical protein
MERLPLPEAARRLGLSSVAARKRAQRGTLHAEKVDGQWFVVLPGPPSETSYGPSNGQATRTAQVDGQSVPSTNGQAVQVDGPTLDSAAAAELGTIAREALAQLAREREVRSQAEQAAAMWQERAHNLEGEIGRLQELLALPAHDEEPEMRRHWWHWRKR